MRFNRVQFPLLLVCLSVGGNVAWAGTQNSAADEKLEVQSLIRMIQTSPQKLNYSGTFVYQQANQIRTSKITHHADANGELEKLEILDGNSREYIRKNDEVSCYLPDSKTIQVEKTSRKKYFQRYFRITPSLCLTYICSKEVRLAALLGSNARLIR